MKLYAWQPNGHGELSFFVMAESEDQARTTVEAEIARRKALPYFDEDRITPTSDAGWGTPYYQLTVAEALVVLTNGND